MICCGAASPRVKPNEALVAEKPKRQFKVGDHIRASMHGGRIVDGVVKETTSGVKYQIAFGKGQTADLNYLPREELKRESLALVSTSVRGVFTQAPHNTNVNRTIFILIWG
jgi:hypothetical protein